jgi:hypothetical protein
MPEAKVDGRRIHAIALNISRTKHGMYKSSEYQAWRDLVQRCTNPDCCNYRHYGARGISVCDRWLGKNGFPAFMEDMGRKPSPLHSIDRINNDGNYEPGNCRWATKKMQRMNQRDSVLVSLDGEVMNQHDLAIRLGIHESQIIRRKKQGRSIEEIIRFYRENPKGGQWK